MKTIKLIIYRIFRNLISLLGYEIHISKADPVLTDNGINLNVGAGNYTIPGFTSLDFYSKHYYPKRKKFNADRVAYDIRNDDLPYASGVVDNIYISHVVEHLEPKHVERFLCEAHSVLRPGGVLRVACPDGRFLYEVSRFENDFWTWRHSLISESEFFEKDPKTFTSFDFLVREVATSRLKWNLARDSEQDFLEPELFVNRDYVDFRDSVNQGSSFREGSPGDHLSIWDADLLRSVGNRVGFRHVLESKFRGSISHVMQGALFDRTHPQMSLYCEFVK